MREAFKCFTKKEGTSQKTPRLCFSKSNKKIIGDLMLILEILRDFVEKVRVNFPQNGVGNGWHQNGTSHPKPPQNETSDTKLIDFLSKVKFVQVKLT